MAVTIALCIWCRCHFTAFHLLASKAIHCCLKSCAEKKNEPCPNEASVVLPRKCTALVRWTFFVYFSSTSHSFMPQAPSVWWRLCAVSYPVVCAIYTNTPLFFFLYSSESQMETPGISLLVRDCFTRRQWKVY